MDHFLEISQLSRQQIEALIKRSLELKQAAEFPSYSNHTVAQLFYENSTRTRVSFELAAHHLAMKVINLDLHHSSEAKGEVIEDTIQNLVAMGIDCFVIRHKEEGLQQRLATSLADSAHIINAGDGTHAHPSQAILDMVTIVEQYQRVDQLKIAIVGNIKHSRVANSLQCIAEKLQVGELVMIAPKLWQPEKVHFGEVTDNLQEGLRNADVIICLRVQRERLLAEEFIDIEAYRTNFALTQSTLAYAKPHAMVMHPGPINRGVEIDSSVADGPQSFILKQVTNGVYARMAIFESLVGKS